MSDVPRLYQLKITLADSRPAIWRRVELFGDESLGELHFIIQGVMNWDTAHLHQFIINPARRRSKASDVLASVGEEQLYSDPSQEIENAQNEWDVLLEEIAPHEGITFLYEYDFGNGWMHEVLVEKISDPDDDVNYPRCIKGKGRAPQEESGGVHGWMLKVDAVNDPDRDRETEANQIRSWLGLKKRERLDPDAFDLAATNRRLDIILNPRADDSDADDNDADWSEYPDEQLLPPEKRTPTVRINSCTITWDKIDPSEEDLPPAVRDEYDMLYQSAMDGLIDGIGRLEELVETYPHASKIWNLFIIFCDNTEDDGKTEAAINECYRRLPNYLFSKVNYAGRFLNARDFQQVAAIFDNKWDLKSQYPERDTFHATEFLAMAYIAGCYFLGIGDKMQASMWMDLMERVDPTYVHPSTQALDDALAIADVAETMTNMAHKASTKKRRKK